MKTWRPETQYDRKGLDGKNTAGNYTVSLSNETLQKKESKFFYADFFFLMESKNMYQMYPKKQK